MPPFPKKKWTIMIYMAGAKTPSYVRDALFEIKRIGSNEDVNVLAQFDTGSDGLATKRYYLTRLEGGRRLYKMIKDMTTPDSLQALQAQLKDLAIKASDGEFGLFRAIERLEVKVGDGTRTLRSVFDEVFDETELRCLQETLRKTNPKQLVESAILLPIYILGALLESDNVSHVGKGPKRRRPEENDIGQTDTGDPRELSKFIQWGIENYPADHRIIVIMGHGDGTSVAWDTTEDFPDISVLDAKELGKALSLHARGVDRGIEHFDIIGFNACQMGTIEVYHRLMGRAEIGIASEAGSPLENWPYRRIIGMLQQHPNLEADEVAKLIVDEFLDRYLDFETESKVDIDIAACEMSKVQGLVKDVGSLADLFLDRLGDGRKPSDAGVRLVRDLFEARKDCESYDVGEFQYVDLSDFCQQLKAKSDDEKVKANCESIVDKVEGMVFRSHPFVLAPRAHGLSIYFPRDGVPVSPKYKDRLEMRGIRWRDFLELYVALVSSLPQ